MDSLFNLLSFAPGPFWLLLFLFPQKRWAMRVFDVFLLFLAMVYSYLTIPAIPELLPIIASPNMESIRELMISDKGLIAGWNHFILADLWIGRWIALDGLDLGIPIYLRIPFLLITLFFGPLGFLSYWIYRFVIHRKGWL